MNTNKNTTERVQQENVTTVHQEESTIMNHKIKLNTVYTPRRFSVRGLRRHTGIQTSRNPRVAY